MNRLIILGNGFDLAHNMQTSYFNFIEYYVKNAFAYAGTMGSYNDDLMTITNGNYLPVRIDRLDSIDFTFLSQFIANNNNPPIIPGPAYEDRKPKWHIKHEFIEALIRRCSHCNWVDIENEYYDALKGALSTSNVESKIQQVTMLNDAFQQLARLLQEYLSGLEVHETIAGYYEIFREPLQKEDIVGTPILNNSNIEKTLILNFNYTPTAEDYLGGEIPGEPIGEFTINYIHGRLNHPTNPIIFGFGDELDSNYQNIENDRTRGAMKFIKSFGYFRNSNYHNLLNFIERDQFQVFVMGHSCGLSDRTMLNMIFEHINCISIRIFYHKTKTGDNFTTLTQEISRHFKNKAAMRKKIVPFDRSRHMPQSF